MRLLTRKHLLYASTLVIILLLMGSLYTTQIRYRQTKHYVDHDMYSLIFDFSRINESIVDNYDWYIEGNGDKPLELYERDLILILQDLDQVYMAYGKDLDSENTRLQWFNLSSYDLGKDIISPKTYTLFLDIHTQIEHILDEHGLSTNALRQMSLSDDDSYDALQDRWLEAFDAISGIAFNY